MEFWDYAALREDVEREAERAESDGWDGLSFADSQNMMPDVYVCLALAARATTRLGLTTGVSNPVTRHANVSASAALALQSISAGRFRLGLGRGDSSLAHIGLNPAPVRTLERYVAVVRQLVSGQSVELEELAELQSTVAPDPKAPSVHNVTESKIMWTSAGTTSPPPVDVVATGPRVITMGATTADGVLLAVGADESRIQWAVDLVRDARRSAGLDVDAFPIGAYVNIAICNDRATARDLVRPALGVYARFASMHGKATGPVSEAQRGVLESTAASYDMQHHGRKGAVGPGALPDSFVDSYAIVGSIDECISRVEGLRKLGISKLLVSRAEPLLSVAHSSAAARAAYLNLTRELIPAVRAAATA